MEYYYLLNDVQKGPVTQSQLLTIVDADTLVWRDGIEWMRAADVPELAGHFIKDTPSERTIPSVETNGSASAKSMFSAAFSFDGRIRRTEYGVSLIIYAVLYYWAYDKYTYSVPWYYLLPMLWFIWAQGAKRCHDRGNSGWWQLIPFYALWMIFAEGESTANQYGAPPK